MCGGWRQDKPEPYRLVILRELVNGNPGRADIDLKHVGFWSGVCWCALSKQRVDGAPLAKGVWKGIDIVNIYGWQEISKMEPNV